MYSATQSGFDEDQRKRKNGMRIFFPSCALCSPFFIPLINHTTVMTDDNKARQTVQDDYGCTPIRQIFIYGEFRFQVRKPFLILTKMY